MTDPLEGAKLLTAKARGTQAVTIPLLTWYQAELERGTPPHELAEAFADILGNALAGFVIQTPRPSGGTVAEAVDYQLTNCKRIALERLGAPGK